MWPVRKSGPLENPEIINHQIVFVDTFEADRAAVVKGNNRVGTGLVHVLGEIVVTGKASASEIEDVFGRDEIIAGLEIVDLIVAVAGAEYEGVAAGFAGENIVAMSSGQLVRSWRANDHVGLALVLSDFKGNGCRAGAAMAV